MSSPHVRTVEYDKSQRVAEFPGMYALVIGNFDKGRVGERMFITRESDADLVLGEPGPNSDQAYFILHSLLQKTQRVWVSRVANAPRYSGTLIGAFYNVSLGTGDGVTTVFSGTLTYSRCLPNSVEIWRDDEKIGYDNGSGVIQGTECSGTVVYTTGAVSITFGATYVPPTGSTIYARWGFPNLDLLTAGISSSVLLDPTTYGFDEREISMELLGTDTTGATITDKLVPTPVIAPVGAVAAYTDATVVIYEGTTPRIYADENGDLQDVGAGPYLDAGGTNTLNYATGALVLELDASYNPTGNLIAKYTSLKSDLFLTYGDSPGVWADLIAPRITAIDLDNDAWKMQIYEQKLTSGQYLVSYTGEEWHISRTEQQDGFGQQMYLEDRINGNSYFVRVLDNVNITESAVIPASSIANNALAFATSALEYMDGGTDGAAVTVANYITALDLFNNKEDVSVNIVVDTLGDETFHVAVADFCDRDRGGRGDCYGVLHSPLALEQSTNYINEIVNFRKYDQNLNTSWCGLYCGHVKVYDTYNGKFIWLPPSGFVAAAFSYTADQYEAWLPAAGWRRGLLSVLDVYRKFTKGERDILYDNGINAMRFRPGKGIAIWGQKTLYGTASALDRANVRWLLIVTENAVEEFLEDFIFELNTALTRKQAQMAVDSYFGSIKNRDGVYEFSIICDESNNSPEEIDNYKMNLDVYVQPTKAAEYLTQRVIITRTGVDFGEVAIS
jgi:hypothetical protein